MYFDAAVVLAVLVLTPRPCSTSPSTCPDPPVSQNQARDCIGGDCLRGNMEYSSLQAAWEACGQEPECAYIMLYRHVAAGHNGYYLRRQADPVCTNRPECLIATMYTYCAGNFVPSRQPPPQPPCPTTPPTSPEVPCPSLNSSRRFTPEAYPSGSGHCAASSLATRGFPCVSSSVSTVSFRDRCSLWVHPGCDAGFAETSTISCDVHAGSVIDFEDGCNEFGCSGSSSSSSINARLTGTWIVGPKSTHDGSNAFWVQRHDQRPHGFSLDAFDGTSSSGRYHCLTTDLDGSGFGLPFCSRDESSSVGIVVGVAVSGLLVCAVVISCSFGRYRRATKASPPSLRLSQQQAGLGGQPDSEHLPRQVSLPTALGVAAAPVTPRVASSGIRVEAPPPPPDVASPPMPVAEELPPPSYAHAAFTHEMPVAQGQVVPACSYPILSAEDHGPATLAADTPLVVEGKYV